jgi:hypothetical protein
VTRVTCVAHVETERVEREAEAVRREQKRILAAISDKCGTPDGVTQAMLRSMLTLSDNA